MRVGLLVVVGVGVIVVAACGGEVGKASVACEKSVDAYCASLGGCPLGPTWDAVCVWGAARGAPDQRGGGPIKCDSGLAGFEVDERDRTTTFLFRGDRLERVWQRT